MEQRYNRERKKEREKERECITVHINLDTMNTVCESIDLKHIVFKFQILIRLTRT